MKRIILAAAALAMMGVAGPNITPGAFVARATTSAKSLSELRGTSANSDAAAYICNPTTTVLCVGGADLNTTYTNGGKCFPVCSSSSCAAQCISLQAPLSQTFVAVASGTLDFYMLYGGWR